MEELALCLRSLRPHLLCVLMFCTQLALPQSSSTFSISELVNQKPLGFDSLGNEVQLVFGKESDFVSASTNGATGTGWFITKRNSHGAYVWAVAIKGGYEDEPQARVDSFDDGVFVYGTFTSVLQVGAFFLAPFPTDKSGFVIKISRQGEVIWAQRFGGAHLRVFEVTPSQKGDALIRGAFRFVATFDSMKLVSTSTSSWGAEYLSKVDSAGAIVWAKLIENEIGIFAGNTVVDTEGNGYLTGEFSQRIVFDRKLTLTNAQSSSYLAKVDKSGNFFWARQPKSGSFNYLAVDHEGFLYLTGMYRNTNVFAGFTLTNAAPPGGFIVAKMDREANVLWGATANSEDQLSIWLPMPKVAADGAIYVTGALWGTNHFGTNVIRSPDSGPYAPDTFLTEISSEGAFKWVTVAKGQPYIYWGQLYPSPFSGLLWLLAAGWETNTTVSINGISVTTSNRNAIFAVSMKAPVKTAPQLHILKADAGQPSLVIQGEELPRYLIETSGDLIRWTPVTMVRSQVAGPALSNGTGSMHFYRAFTR